MGVSLMGKFVSKIVSTVLSYFGVGNEVEPVISKSPAPLTGVTRDEKILSKD